MQELVDQVLDQNSMEFMETAYINAADGSTTIKFNQIVAFELIEEPFDLEKEMAKILAIIDQAILQTPSGNIRNRLADINIFLRGENEVIKKLSEAE